MKVAELIPALRLEAGRSGSVECLTLLRNLDVLEIDGLPYPIPMAFPDAWGEVFDLLIAEASKP